jgi:hypothetical protein
MTCPKFAAGMLFCATVFAAAGADEPTTSEKKPAAGVEKTKSAFERFQRLVGDWEYQNPKEEALKGKTVVRYKLTGSGSAVVETLFPGEEKEMISVYTRDGSQLVLTHYCCAGNQPTMRAKIGEGTDEIAFEFTGGNNLDPAKDFFMHGYTVRFVDADHIVGSWEYYQGGKSGGKHSFDLVRKKK